MQYCPHCNVSVSVPRRYCPLCQSELAGQFSREKEIFPVIPTVYREHSPFFRLLIFVSVAAAVSCVLLNILLPSETWWSVIVLAALGYMWLTITTAVRKRVSHSRSALYQVVGLSVMLYIIDRLTGNYGWAIDYVIPILCISAIFAIAIIAKVSKLPLESFMVYLLINGLLGFVPLIFILLNWTDVVWPSLACVIASALCFFALFIFGEKKAWAELRKRLHL